MKTSQKPGRAVVAYFWRKAWSEKRLLIAIFSSLPLNVLMNRVIPPIILADVLNRLAAHNFKPHDIWGSFGWELVIYAIIITAGSMSWRIIDIFAWRLEGRVEKSIAAEVFSHLLSQSAKFHADHFSGSLVSRTNKLMGGYVRAADTTMFNVLPMLLGVVFSVIVLVKVSPLFALALALFAILYFVVSTIVTRKPRRLGAEHAEIESRQTGYLADATMNVMSIKSFAGQKYEERRFNQALDKTQASLFRFGGAMQKQQASFGGLISLINSLALFMAVLSVMTFDANVAAVFLIFNYTASVGSDLFSFSNNALRNYNRSLGDSAEMVQILALEPEVQDPPQPERPKINRGEIRFKDVTFAHNDAKGNLFEKLNIQIKPGEKVGLVGHSGSGKTTLTRLLLRFSDIQSGEITIDGQNVAAITQDDLRSFVAYVPQEPMLFHRTIAENISYSNPSATQQEIEAVAKLANAEEFIVDLPNGYDTLVGERGVKLSGGQRQRVAIARAMLKNAPILLLDEATSALDSESEGLIQDALFKLMENRTAVVIAHRLSTIQKMDRIIVMADGKVVEEGSHRELLAQNGTYAKLWAHQSGGFIEG
jgi:ATP-binding cassette subfamily B protein